MTSLGERRAIGQDLVKALGLWDVILMNIVAVVGLRWIARGARMGPASLTMWVLAWAAFFVPLAATLGELSRRYPDQGGLYAWTRRAFGPVHGFICGWCLWVNNLFYFPSLLLFGAANAALALGSGSASLADSRFYSVAFVTIGLWLCVALNIVGLRVGKWLQNLGSLGTWGPAALLIGGGVVAFAAYGSATSFAPATLVPREDFWSNLGLWSAMCFAFSGFEVTSLVAQEVREPTRTIPRGVLIAGGLVTAIYIAGSASVLAAVPASALAERTGIADAIELVSGRVGLAGLGGLTGGLLALGALAGTGSWVAGAARVPFAAGVDRVLPRSLARLHPTYRTPHVALIVQGLAATAIFLTSVFLTVAGQQTDVQEAYDIMVNLTILIYFVPYLYLFLALPRLRRHDAAGEGRQVPHDAGRPMLAAIGFVATAVSLALVFVPPAGTGNVLNYEANLLLQTTMVMMIGIGLFRHASRTRRGSGEEF